MEFKKQETFTKVLVTPEKAKRYLLSNVQNRALIGNYVRSYRDLMLRGKWGYNPADPIVFDVNGRLINGQHRLNAVVESDTSQYFDIVINAPRNSYIYMDCGKMRSMADVFTYNGVKNAKASSSIIKSYYALKKKVKENSRYGEKLLGMSRDEYLEEYSSYSSFYDEVISFSKSKHHKLKILRVAQIGGLYVYLVKDRKHNEGKVREFFNELLLGCRFKV